MSARLEQIITRLERAQHERFMIMSAQLDALTAEVSSIKSTTAAAVTAIQGLRSQLDAAIAANKAGDNGAALDALTADLKTTEGSLGAAIATPGPVDAPVPATT